MKKTKIKSEDLIPIKQAYEKFGDGWHPRTIYRRIEDGELIEGIHFINDARTNSVRRRIKLIKPAIEEMRGTLIYQR